MKLNTKDNFEKLIEEWENVKLKRFNSEDLELKNSRRILTNQKYFSKRDYYNVEISTTYPYINQLDLFLTTVLGWIHCNPSKEKTVSLAEEAFCWPKNHDQNIRALNSKNGFQNFFDYLTRSNGGNGDIAIITAPKGFGKTYTQNYFLNTHTRALAKKRYVWFRIDLTKILKYEKRYGKKLSLSDYLYAQITYVFLRYRKSLNGTIGVDTIFADLDIKIIKKEAKLQYKGDDFELKYKNLVSFCRDIKSVNDGLNKPFHNALTLPLAYAIINNLKDKKYEYLVFIDGIDNVDYAYDRNLESWTKQIFEGEIAKKIRPSSLILSCRPETLTFIYQIYKNNMPFNIQEYFLDALQPEELLKNLFDHTINKRNNEQSIIYKYFDTYKKNTDDSETLKNDTNNFDFTLYSNTSKELIKDFFNFGLKFKKFLISDINKRYYNLDLDLNEENIMEVLYNHSLRDMLYDIKYAFMYIHHYIITEHARKRLKVNITVTDYIAKENNKKAYLVTAAIARHGRIYFNDKSLFVPPFRLLHSLNLFSLLDLKSRNGLMTKDMLIPLVILKTLQKKILLISKRT